MWQKVPEEERKEILIHAHSKAVETCSTLTLVGGAAAVALRMPWILVGVVMLVPVLYQVITKRMWLESKPRTLIRYFVASLTARRYASLVAAADTSLKLIFRGSLESVPLEEETKSSDEEVQAFADELKEEKIPPRDVWISLFPDSLVMISEGETGARLEFAHSTLQDFVVALDSPEDESGDSQVNRLLIQTGNEEQITGRWILTSGHTSSLVACERKIRFFSQRAAQAANERGLTNLS